MILRIQTAGEVTVREQADEYKLEGGCLLLFQRWAKATPYDDGLRLTRAYGVNGWVAFHLDDNDATE